MENYNLQDNGHSHKGVILLDRMIKEIERLKVDRMTDLHLYRFLQNLIIELEDLKTLIVKRPRFKFEIIQQEIDRLYKIDNNLSGIRIYLDWKDGENRAFFKHKIQKIS